MTKLTHGFELIEERNIPEINSLCRLYRHAKSGAHLLSMINDDENKVFGITFATPPTDSTCGAERSTSGLPESRRLALLRTMSSSSDLPSA